MSPRRTSALGESDCTRSPANTIAPLVTSPRSEWSRFETAFSVVVFPAPLAPSNATMPPLGTSSETPLSTKMIRSYTTSMLLIKSMLEAVTPAGPVRGAPELIAPAEPRRRTAEPGANRQLSPSPRYDGLSQGSVRFGQPGLELAYFCASA